MARRIGRSDVPSNRLVECLVESVGRMSRRIGDRVGRPLIFERRENPPRVDPRHIPYLEGREMVGALDEESRA